jgi:hypothetical protein
MGLFTCRFAWYLRALANAHRFLADAIPLSYAIPVVRLASFYASHSRSS